MKKHDVLVLGGGHNGLIAACYLAKAGFDVGVVEKNDTVGGGTLTREVTLPGFKSDLASVAHQFLQSSPLLVNDELGLKSKYGLEYLVLDGPQSGHIEKDGRGWLVYRDLDRTLEQIAKISEHDAEAYKEFYDEGMKMFSMLMTGSQSAQPPFGQFVSFLEQTAEGRDVVNMMFSSCIDVLEGRFESDIVKGYLARYTSEAMVNPYDKGTAQYLYMMIPATHSAGLALPKGGSQQLCNALEKCLKDLGGTVYLNSEVVKVELSGGEAKGVLLASGESIEAEKGIICTLNIKQLFGNLVEPDCEYLPDGFSKKISKLRSNPFVPFTVHFALNEPIRWKAEDQNPDFAICPHVEYNADSWDRYMHNYMDMALGHPIYDQFAWMEFDKNDPSRCPAGKGVAELYHFAPAHLRGGKQRWDSIKEEVADKMVAVVADKAKNLTPENILARYVMSPLDIERMDNAMVDGDIQFLGTEVAQYYGNRPVPECRDYTTPIGKLYIAGSSTYPGGGMMGAARAALPNIFEYLGADFDSVTA